MRTFDSKKGQKILDIVRKHGPIGFRELQRKTCFSSRRTLELWLKHLVELGISDKDNQGKIVLTKAAKIEFAKNGTIIIPKDSRRKETNNNSRTLLTTERKVKNKILFKDKRGKEKRDKVYTILVSKAAYGDSRFRRTLKSQYGNSSMFDIRTRKEQNYSPYHIPGVGLSDFSRKIKGPAMLDRRIHVGHMELFAHIDFTESEVQQYINELKNREYQVLKQLSIFKFNVLEFDNIENDLQTIKFLSEYDYNSFNSIAANKDEKTKLSLTTVNEYEENRLKLIHDIYYNQNNNGIHNITKLIFDINNPRNIKVLGLDTYYNDDNNNFSTAVWREPRYIIADPLLREFIIICWTILGFVFFKMIEIYVYKLWPKHRVRLSDGIRSAKDESSYVYHLYMKWYKRLFGKYRFTQHNFSRLLARKRNFEKLDKRTQKEELANANDLIKSYDDGIKESYKIIMSEKYAAIRDKYKDVITALLDMSYPDFVKECH